MIKDKTPLPITKHAETDTDKYFTYLVNHVTRQSERQPIATISPDQSARRTWTTPQVTMLAILATLTLIALWCFGTPVLSGLFACVTCLYVALLAMATSWMVAVSRAQPETPFDETIITDLAKAPWPAYTVLCPLYHEKTIVPQFVQAMQALDYPQDCLQVLFLTEQDDRETRAAIRAMNLPANFQVLVVPQGTPKTKPRACNYGLTKASGEYVVIFDAEDIPDPLQLKKAVLTFASSPVNVACVQARLNFYNPHQNMLTRWFTVEYSLWFDLILPGLQRLGFSLPLGGTSNHFRIAALKALGGWDSYNVTEDADLGLKLVKYGFRTIMLDSTTYEEANSQILSWVKQRSRWIKGYMQTYLVHTRQPLKALRQGKIKGLLSLHLFVGAGSLVLLINPVMWAMFAVYLIWRPVDLYHQLFPWPVLYAGMLCFLVGNFLPIYVSMIACVKREQYSLVKWCLLLPLYWILASIAAFLAGYELIRNPHKWHKTAHGLHLKDRKSTEQIAAISMKVPAVSGVAKVGTVTASVKAMSTVLVPVVSKKRSRRAVRARDPWLVATIVLACVCSAVATVYFFIHHGTLLYADAQSHIRLARSLFDSRTPGFAQLGEVWLPLHHMFIVPFIWNGYLWRTGLAGVIPAMVAFVVGAICTYETMKLLTREPAIAFIVTLGYVTNPNLLYLQSTPLSDTFCVCFFAITCYYFICWLQKGNILNFCLMSCGVWCITLIRYDGWALSMALSALIGLVCLLRRYRLQKTLGFIALYGALAFMGIILWLIWCKVITGNFFFFQSGPYSAQSQQLELLNNNVLPTFHNVLLDIKGYIADGYDNTGIIYFIVAPVSILLFLFIHRKRLDYVVVLVACVPFAFYVLTLYSGQSVIYIPGQTPKSVAPNTLFNTRYGIQVLIPVLILFASFLSFVLAKIKFRRIRTLVLITFTGVIITQSAWMMKDNPITFKEGIQQCIYTLPYVKQEDIFFEEHNDDGGILTDIHASSIDTRNFGTDLSQLVNESNGSVWRVTLLHPERYVHFIAFTPNDLVHDGVAQAMHVQHNTFLKYYRLVLKSSDGVQVYLLKSIKSLPNRPLPQSWVAAEHWCSEL